MSIEEAVVGAEKTTCQLGYIQPAALHPNIFPRSVINPIDGYRVVRAVITGHSLSPRKSFEISEAAPYTSQGRQNLFVYLFVAGGPHLDNTCSGPRWALGNESSSSAAAGCIAPEGVSLRCDLPFVPPGAETCVSYYSPSCPRRL